MDNQDEYTVLMLLNLVENIRSGNIKILDRSTQRLSDTVCTVMLTFEGIPKSDKNLDAAADMILDNKIGD